MSVIDTRTRKVKATIKTGSGPFEIAVTPDRKYAYVVNKRDNTAQVIKRKTNTIIRTIQVGKSPSDVGTSRKFVYVTNSADYTVSVICIKKQRVVETIKVGKNPVGVTITPKKMAKEL